MTMKALTTIFFCAALGAIAAIYTPGSGGTGSGSGSITNLSPSSAMLTRSTLRVITATNSARNFTNWSAGSGSNMVADVSGTNGYIRVTNNGLYMLSISASYRPATNSIGILRTNSFDIATNVGGVGLTSSGVGFTTTMIGNTNYISSTAVGSVYLTSNTYVSLTISSTSGHATNDIAIERAALSVSLISGLTLGAGGGVASVAHDNAVFVDLANGSDTTGTRERFDLPVATLTNAAALAQYGDTIVVRPGIYTMGTNQFITLESGVKWYFEPGSEVRIPDNPNRDNGSSEGTPFFHDLNTVATNAGVYGHGKFFSTNNVGGILQQSNLLSKVYFEADTVSMAGTETAIIRKGGDLTFNIWNLGGSYYDFYGDAASDPNTGRVAGYAKRIEVGDSLIEMSAAFASPGDCYIRFDYGLKTNYNFASYGGIEIRDNSTVEFGFARFERRGVLAGYGPTGTNAIIRGGTLVFGSDTDAAAVGVFGSVVGGTYLTLDGVTIDYKGTNNPVFVHGSPLILRNCSILGSSFTTNIFWATNAAETVQIQGTFSFNKPLKGANVTIVRGGNTNLIANPLLWGTTYAESVDAKSNVTVRGSLVMPGLTASKVWYLDSSGAAASVTGSGTYVKADGTTGDPTGSGSTNNVVTSQNYAEIGSIRLTNSVLRSITNATATSFTFIWPGPDVVRWAPTGTGTMSESGAPSAGDPARKKDLYILTTQTINWPSGWRTRDTNEASPILIAGITNRFTVEFDGTNTFVESHQARVSGTGPLLAQTNSTIYTPTIGYVPVAITGTGGANTNFTLQATQPETYINAFTNVSIRAVMSYTAGLAHYWTCTITNNSGSDRTLEFSAVTNKFKLMGVYGPTGPSVITNGTGWVLAGRSEGTNTLVGYSSFTWP